MSLLRGGLHGTGDGFRVVVDVETLVDCRWDRLDVNAQVLLDVVEVKAVLPVDQVDGQAKMAVAA